MSHYLAKRADVWELARKLAPYSPRLRALLSTRRRASVVAFEANVGERLGDLVEDVLAQLGVNEDGEVGGVLWTPPLPPSVAGGCFADWPEGDNSAFFWPVVQHMARRRYFRTARHRDQQAFVDRVGAWAPLRAFEAGVVSRFERWHVPVYAHEFVRPTAVQARLFVTGEVAVEASDAAICHGMAVDIRHCFLPAEMDVSCWSLIREVGEREARALNVGLLPGDQGRPG